MDLFNIVKFFIVVNRFLKDVLGMFQVADFSNALREEYIDIL